MLNRIVKSFTVVAGACVIAFAFSQSTRAASLRQGSSALGSDVTGKLPGEVLWGYYLTNDSFAGFGDSILRLTNPNGAANANLGVATQTVCAMIYVFDQEQEMGECCGCPLSSTQLATFSIYQNLTSNWGLQVINEAGGEDSYPAGAASNAYGSLAVVAAAANTTACLGGGGGAACNGGCDPTNVPGYSVSTTNNLLGSITHNQGLPETTNPSGPFISGLTETPLSDDGGGDPTNLIYLQLQCGALVGDGTGGGICNCPTEG